MTRAKLSEAGSLNLPRALRDAVGLRPGAEVEITENAGRLILEPVDGDIAEKNPERKLTINEFLASIPRYDGPPITDKMIHEAIEIEARRMWNEFERRSNENDRG